MNDFKNPYGELLENLHAPELYVTSASSLAMVSGVLTITLISSRVDNSGNLSTRRRVVVGRISMPVAAGADLATQLYSFLNNNGFPFASPEEKARVQ